MEGLRRAVHQEGPTAGHITLTVARKVRQGSIKDREGEGQSDDANGTIRIGAEAVAAAVVATVQAATTIPEAAVINRDPPSFSSVVAPSVVRGTRRNTCQDSLISAMKATTA